ncbi:hypothetical protein M0R45_025930 [Rubus argutus]|uniref:Uncharacterized protein n=1 Tax=Rubus argutus TaxID=59490 RepID=A0AAW1WXN3_RUBAR
MQKRNNKYRREFIELFKKVNINIPLLDDIKQFPPYAKFLKEICTNKRKFMKDEQIILSEDVSAVLQGKLPPKLNDPGSFTVPCIIGNKGFDKAMLDLGASINLMPYDIYKTLALDDIKPAKISLKLADRSQVVPMGIVEDVLVKIGELLIPADFVILDMKDIASGGEEEMPILFGRPFMATAGTKIDVKEGILTMTVFETTIGFRIFDAMRSPMPLGDCFKIDVVDEAIATSFIDTNSRDPLETSLVYPDMDFLDEEIVDATSALTTTPPTSTPYCFQPLTYAFLGDDETHPVVMSSKLLTCEEEKLLEVLREHKTAFGWTIADIKGIIVSVCTHNIYMEEDNKPTRDPQRRLNPPMMEVVKKEVTKLLDHEIIYPISDSKWVSPVQVVPKKGGLTIVKNDRGEDVPRSKGS